jgi:hypothetical protein
MPHLNAFQYILSLMHFECARPREEKAHADVCNKNRSISAQSVNELATKMGCPSKYTTKLSKLGWMFMTKLWHTNAYTCEHTRVNASAYTSECGCE